MSAPGYQKDQLVQLALPEGFLWCLVVAHEPESGRLSVEFASRHGKKDTAEVMDDLVMASVPLPQQETSNEERNRAAVWPVFDGDGGAEDVPGGQGTWRSLRTA